jgi:iron complex outermembrane recepter protein
MRARGTPRRGRARGAALGIVRTMLNAARRPLLCLTLALLYAPLTQAKPGDLPALAASIPAQPLSQSLVDFAQQTGLQFIYESDVIGNLRSRAVPAGVSADHALKRLLKGTGLSFEFLNTRTVLIRKIARADTPPTESAPAASPEQEVIVTASILRERSDNTPMSQVMWTGEAMSVAGIKDITTLASLTPGVEFDSYSDYGAGFETNISIRGIDARDGSTVAVYLDDVPLPTDRLFAFGRIFPFTFDMSRVEVLRGPQGVLLGEGAEGGGVRFVTTPPSVNHFDSLVHGEFASTDGGAPSYEVGGELGGPLVTGTAGFRLSAWSRENGGYVDRVNPFSGTMVDPNANSMRQKAFSAAVALVSTEVVRVTPAIRYQSLDVSDTSSFYTYLSDVNKGMLHNGKLVSQPYSDAFSLTSLDVWANLGWSILKFDAARLSRNADALYDDDRDLHAVTPVDVNAWKVCPPDPRGLEYPAPCFPGLPFLESLSNLMWYGGLTLASSGLQDGVTWLAGAGYGWSRYNGIQDQLATTAIANQGNTPIGVSDGGLLTEAALLNTTRQFELHGMVNTHLARRFEASFGVRIERESFDLAWHDVPYPYPHSRGDSTVAAPRLSLTFQPEYRTLAYVTLANGYRMGGPNPNTACNTCTATLPVAYKPDSVWNFEVGSRSTSLNGQLQLDISLFHMVWRNIQAQALDNQGNFSHLNAGRAASDGFDFGTHITPTEHLSLTLMAAYANARYTTTDYATVPGFQPGFLIAQSGDALGAVPEVPPPWTVTTIGEYVFRLHRGLAVTLRAQDGFASRNPGPFTSDHRDAIVYAPERRADPSINRLDLSARAGDDNFEVSVFVNNVLNSQPILQFRNRIPTDTLFYGTTLRPRTVGLTATWRFGSRR